MGTASQAIGHFEQGTATSILALVDSPGHLVRFKLDLGRAGDLASAPPLPEGLDFVTLIGDKAFDADGLAAKTE